MPYSPEHKQRTRAKITEAARVLFNRHGFEAVTIDMVMAAAGLTRGGFYNHFDSKEKLFTESVTGFLNGRGAQWREEAGVTSTAENLESTHAMLRSYLSPEHLADLDGQCPMIALPSDIARAAPEVQQSYQVLLEAMVGLFERDMERKSGTMRSAKESPPKNASKKESKKAASKSAAKSLAQDQRQIALALAALSIGGMIVARTLSSSSLAEEVRDAAYTLATQMVNSST